MTAARLSAKGKKTCKMRSSGDLALIYRWLLAIVTFVFPTFGAVSASEAEVVLSAYGGKATTMDGDLKLVQPGGLRLTFNAVSWTDESLQDPPYYGLRVAFYLPQALTWGFAVDYTHAKTILQTNEVVHVTGRRAGVAVNRAERISDTIQGFELSHGHNLLTFNLMCRWFPKGERDPSWLGRTQPYVGAGVGIAIPHVEVMINGVKTDEYQVTGPAAEGLVGLNFDLIRFVSVFNEYKITYADVTAELHGGRTIAVQPITHHFALGVSLRF